MADLFIAPIAGTTIFVSLSGKYEYVVVADDVTDAISEVAPSPAAGLIPVTPNGGIVVRSKETGALGYLTHRDVRLHRVNATVPVIYARHLENGTPTGAIIASLLRKSEKDVEVAAGTSVTFENNGWTISVTYEVLLASIPPGENLPLYYEINSQMINDPQYNRFDFIRRISTEPFPSSRGPIPPGSATFGVFGPYGSDIVTYKTLEEIIVASRKKLLPCNLTA